GVLRLRDLIYDFRPAETEEGFRNWVGHAAPVPAEGYTGEDYAEHIRTEFSTFRWLLEPMLAEAGFEIADAKYQGRLYGAYTRLRRRSGAPRTRPPPPGPGRAGRARRPGRPQASAGWPDG